MSQSVNNAPSFRGTGTGKVLTPVGAGTSSDIARSVTVQADGKIVVAGQGAGSGSDFAVVRYNADGSLDTGFGAGGKVLTPVGAGTSVDNGYSVTVQADGKIVVAGYGSGSGTDFAVVRYNADGSLDTGFNGTGKVLTPVGAGTSGDAGYSVTVQADGKIVVAGYGFGSGGNDFAVVRYNADGSLDTGFNGTGKVLTPVGTGTSGDFGNSVTVQADGKIVVAGQGAGSGTGNDFAVVRYNADGGLDTGFGVGGKVLTPVGTGTSSDVGNSVTVQADGKIVVAGYGIGSGGNNDFAVVRYNADGGLDTGFGVGGKVLTPVGAGTSTDIGNSVTVQADGKIVVAGYGIGSGGNDFAVVRYNSDGSLDTGFGAGGKVLTPVGAGTSGDIGYSVTVQADGKIVVAGFGIGSGNDFAVVRYNADGSLDTTFNAPSTLGGTAAFTENGAAVVLDTDVAISDVELDGLNGGLGDYAGATLTLARQGGASAQDAFGFAPTGFTVSGATLLDTNGVAFASFTNAGGTLVVTFTGTNVATSALADAVARAVTYANTSDAPPASVPVAWTFSDGGADARTTTGTTTVVITAVNDALVFTGTQATLADGREDTAFTVTSAQLLQGFTDPDGTTPGVSNFSVDHGTFVSDGAGGYTITPTANYSGPVTISYSVSDGTTSIPATLSTTLTAVNDAPSFSGVGTGKVLTPVGAGTSTDVGYSVTVQADGKIVVAGQGAGSGTGDDFAVVRYNANGSLDTSFGDGGKVLTPVGAGTSSDIGYSVTVQADGKIVVAGYGIGSGTGPDFAVVRYTIDGNLDTSFNGTGKVLTPVGIENDFGASVTVQADGKIVVAGYGIGSGTGTDFAVVRYNADGSLDTGFGAGGKVLTQVGSSPSADIGFSVTMQTDGKIVVAGFSTNSGSETGNDLAVVRYLADGSLDTGFGAGGKVLTSVGTGTSSDIGYSVTVQTDGKIVVAGQGAGSGSGSDFAVVRYNADGSLDTGFGAGGKVLTPVGTGASDDIARSVTVQADGKIVVAGFGIGSGNDFAVVRYNADGGLDTGFGAGGKVLTPVGTGTSGDIGFGVTVQADGKIVVAGSGIGSGGNDFAVVRYNADGSLDLTFSALNILSGTAAFTEDGAAVRLDIYVAISDVELDGLNGGLGDYAGATLTLARQGGASAQDAFGFAPTGFSVSGSSLLDTNGAAFATFTTTGGTLVVTFTGTNVATSALADAVARAVTYANTSAAPPASVPVAWTFSDGGTDAKTTTGTTTVTITAVDDAPVLTGTQATLAAGTEDTAFTVTSAQLLQGFSDPDGTTPVVSDLSVDHGTVVSDGAGGYTITPTADYSGPVTISYSVGDGTTSILATLSTTLTAVNDAPRLTGTQATLADGIEDTAFTVTSAQLLQGFTDPEGTTPTVSNLSVDHGTIAADGAGGYTITPTADYSGPVTISYSVGDGTTSTPATLSTTLAAANDAPRLTGTQATLADGTEDTAFTVTTEQLLEGFSDPDGTTPVVSNLRVSIGTIVSNGEGGYTVTPADNYNGPITINYSVGDGTASILASLSTTLVAENDAPVLVRPAAVAIAENAAPGTVIATLSATDVDDATSDLRYAITSGNDDGLFAIDAVTGAVTLAAGKHLDHETATSHRLTVVATDVAGLPSASKGKDLTITVTDLNEATTITATPSHEGTLKEGDTVTFTLSTESAIDVVGTPVLTLDNGGSASYAGLDDDGRATFIYTVASGQDTTDLTVTGLSPDGGSLDKAGTFGLGTAADVSVGSDPNSVTVADVNGDGHLDILAANYGSNSVSVRLGDGKGTFSGVTDVPVGSGPISVTVADVNADGKLDILTANNSTNTVSVRLGDGTGTFSGTTDVMVGPNPYSVTVADVNGDGKLDILAANFSSNSISVRLGDGDGNFSGGTTVLVGSRPTSVTVADVNGDGKLDILAANAGSNSVSVRLGDEAGTFSGGSNVLVGSGPVSVAVADVNGDGKLDILTANQGSDTVSVRLGDGTGTFSGETDVSVGSAPTSVAVADVNGDGKLDILTANNGSGTVSVRLGDGAGAFSGGTDVAVGSFPTSVAIADVNGDGKLDIVATNSGSSTVAVVLNTSTDTLAFDTGSVNASTSGATTGRAIDSTTPALTGTPAALADGTEDTDYAFTSAQLLEGWTDAGGQTLSVSGLSVTHGTLVDDGAGGYMITPDADYAGTLTISYNVGDGTASIPATLSATLAAVNDAPSFNGVGSGEVLTPVGAGTSSDIGRSVTVQADGKIVVAGQGQNSDGNNDFAVVRYNADGSLDTGFGVGGKLLTPVGTSSDIGRSVTVQADGKIVVAGNGVGGNTDFAVVRYNADGSLDTGFGAGGKLLTAVGTSTDVGYSVRVQADGRIVVAGYGTGPDRSFDVAVVRYNADGSLDTGFGPNGTGKVLTPVSPGVSDDIGFDVTVQADGKIVVAGYGAGSGGNNDFAVVRYNADGGLDTTFNGTGKVLTPVGTSTDVGNSVTVQADGKIVVAGYGTGSIGNNDFAVVRYNVDGSLDTSFNGTGKVLTPVGTSGDFGQSVTVQADGKIVVAGYGIGSGGNTDFAVVRYNADGSLDTGFGAGGKVLTPVGTSGDFGYSVTVQADGKIVVVGYGAGSGSDDFAVVRYNANGSLDTTFNAPSTLGGTVAFTENGAAVVLDTDVAISDLELDGLNGGLGDYAGATLTLARQGGADAEDAFGFAPTGFTVSGASLLDTNGTTFASFTNTGGTLVVTFIGANVATAALADSVARAVTYANTSDAPPASVPVAWTFSDGGTDARTTAGTTTVAITAVNDAPRLTGTQATLADGTEDTAFTVTSDQLLQGFTDPDGTTPVLSNLSVDHGTVVSDGAGGYTITPTANYNGPLTISYDVGDGVSSVAATRDVTITAVADAPVLAAPGTVILSESAAPGTRVATLSATDPDGAGVLTYSIQGGNQAGLFTIDATTGVIALAAGRSVDAQTTARHVLGVRATDGSGLVDDRSLTIDVLDVDRAGVLTLTGLTDGNAREGTP
ncbi:cadherin-like domain-containing protein, partial [Methylobacterium sp. Leaf108]|uniref:cadherin-like domain-containing protein n=1 Tax=Methylobacterium sp. Leaf108 TaxID=1736256 RepID=UPI0006F37E73